MAGKRFLDVEEDDVKYWRGDCPKRCDRCWCDPNQKTLSIHVICHGRSITSFPKVLPEWTTFLDLSGNLLNTVPANLSQILSNLQTLDLRGNKLVSLFNVQMPRDLEILNVSRNEIDSLDKVKLSSGLKILDLSENRIQRFPLDILSKLNLEELKISRNVLICDCLTDAFRTWLRYNKENVTDIKEVRCSSISTQKELVGKTIVDLEHDDLCPMQIALYIIVIIGVLVFLFGASAGSLGYIRYQMPIKVWLYTKGLCLRWVKEEDLDEDKDFDGFVAFSSEEQDCVDQILQELEQKEPHYRLCVHYRDFLAGEMIVENIARAVGSSKKILILLSRPFLESEWTMQEFREAHSQTMEQKINRIILVLVGELPSNQDIPPDVRAYMQTATFLKWNEKYFWEKLRYAMPNKPVQVAEPDTITPMCNSERDRLLHRK